MLGTHQGGYAGYTPRRPYSLVCTSRYTAGYSSYYTPWVHQSTPVPAAECTPCRQQCCLITAWALSLLVPWVRDLCAESSLSLWRKNDNSAQSDAAKLRENYERLDRTRVTLTRRHSRSLVGDRQATWVLSDVNDVDNVAKTAPRPCSVSLMLLMSSMLPV